VNFLEKKGDRAWVRLRIAEGRYHQVRKMFEAIGHRVTKLRRVAIGPLELSGLEPGEWRYLTAKEVKELNDYVDRRAAETAGQRPPPDAPRRPAPLPRQAGGSADRHALDLLTGLPSPIAS
jgi:23S rRNA pseudouridine2605 synthase